ncbi:MAG TPA: DNA alkylation repair protein [Ignavibacteriaceae bacterium]|jgi:3-methyladenine DNA glycosylase AlkD|nr:DNA alkylation repair protein [Ignavibacteriaceae bacterium]
MGLTELRSELKKEADQEQAVNLQRFFKTGKGEYGEGDIFYGIKVPVQRRTAKNYRDISLEDVRELLNSPIHEERLVSLFILVDQYTTGDDKTKEKIFRFYIKNTGKINNWDLVDLSAPKIIGAHLFNRDKEILFKFAASSNLWERRIAILSTMFFIKNLHFETTFRLAEILLNDKHDLIHKGVGWMLREIGNKNITEEEIFLKKYYKLMPRTMLRYAIEKFPEERRKSYLQGNI